METHVTFQPESVSPNYDGYNDEFVITYQFPVAGKVCNAWIYDSYGRLMFQLVKNELLGTSGSLTWDGKDEMSQKLPLGIYVVMLEVFDQHGHIEYFKDACVLTDILE